MAAEKTVEIKNLYKTYGDGEAKVEALKNINIDIYKGEIFGIIGLSGAGKSSLVRCINLLEVPERGEVSINGKDITKISKAELRKERKNIGMIFQHFNLLMNSTVYDNIAFPLKLIKTPKEKIEKRVTELLEIVGLSDKKDVYPSQLSGGQKQRVGIARAIATEPDIIMCDEATSALDPETTKSILQLIKEINAKLRVTVIIITHEMEVIKQVCDRVAVLNHGEIAETGNVSDIYINPATETAKKFFKSIDTKLDNNIYQKALKEPGVVIQAIFRGDKSTDPYISNMIKEYDVTAAILLGNIQSMENMLVGTLILRVDGKKENVSAALKYLENSGVIVEVLK
ncbi:MAG: ATP-binding cassette domain-containing protein [Clostridiales bacterium]|nr:ATP-binding cassette domain-containing protein [Clostridiales bacterium]